jgi:hypothetical protein
MKKAIAILIIASAFYWWQREPATPVAKTTVVTAPAVRNSNVVIVPASQGGLDGKGGWEFQSNVKTGENAQTDLTMKRNW